MLHLFDCIYANRCTGGGTTETVNAVRDAVAAALAAAGAGPGARLCCALSGGVDSVVLLDTLAAWRSHLEFDLQAAHVHHGLHPEADAWQAFCEDECRRRGVLLHVFRVDVARDSSRGLEASARAARHAALAQLDCDWLVLGHHRDDQAETVLFRLLRGAGVRGAAAMEAVEPSEVSGRAGRLRPLLEMGRAEIVVYARARGLAWVTDASNASLEFARNDLRHRILPAIEERFPAARVTLARAAKHFREASGLLDELAAADARSCASVDGALERDALLGLSPARLANLLRWEAWRQGAYAPTAVRLAEAVRQLRGSERSLRFPLGDAVLCSRRGRVWLEAGNASGQVFEHRE